MDTAAGGGRAAASRPALPVALLFPGQGSQHTRMAAGLYRHEPVFTAAMDELFGTLGPPGAAVRADWLAADPVVPIDHVTRSQILLFAVDYALGRLILSWGVRPAALLGHSVGELAAATLAGVFSLADAAKLLWDRVNRLAAAPPGGMIAVAAAARELAAYLGGDVAVGAVNAPRQTIVAGLDDGLRAAAEAMRRDGIVVRPVASSTAFHSPALAGLAGLAAAEPLFAATPTRPPAMTMYSGYTGTVLRAEEATSPAYWARQPAAPVLFWPALEALLGTGPLLLCEAGPGQGLTAVARQHPEVASDRSAVQPLLPARPGRRCRRSPAAGRDRRPHRRRLSRPSQESHQCGLRLSGASRAGEGLPIGSNGPRVADALSERWGGLLVESYDCVDRIVLNAYYSMGHNLGGFRTWRRLRGSDEELDNAHMLRLAGRFTRCPGIRRSARR